LYKMSDVMIPIVDDKEENLRNEISVGNTNRIDHSRIGIDGDCGYILLASWSLKRFFTKAILNITR
jgi:hypothetical protein